MMNAVISDRLKARFDRWDVAGKGVLRRSDFEHEADRIVRAFGRGSTSPAARDLRNALCWMFDVVAGESGARPDGSVNEQQFRRVCEDLIFEQGEAAFNRMLTPVLTAVIGLCAKKDEGRIDRAEFAKWLSAHGMSVADGGVAFDKIDHYGRGELSLNQMLQAVRDYHYGRLDIELISGRPRSFPAGGASRSGVHRKRSS
ncbi:MAG: EF-hand domain-containing protein [Saccharopolyspora sp.]|uniref:EF-hand domain-containing protein n=1 Tax=Saccharopolyspora TaxID=1835 RepID=UPI00190BB1AB|nr:MULTISPECIES: EF-hand domain-containing protein [unclassified Saccharopolyspora]MBK0869259.1 EF-hand domain-containing protein [Saccharopolyspora sp. HNM0986]MBQ6639872.1 EF-hand domain-containing protein [Saccharopolyspora sp.]